jgi:hypothetical protein
MKRITQAKKLHFVLSHGTFQRLTYTEYREVLKNESSTPESLENALNELDKHHADGLYIYAFTPNIHAKAIGYDEVVLFSKNPYTLIDVVFYYNTNM